MKTIIIYSGGLDSTALLLLLAANSDNEVKCLSINYGQRHVRELVAAHRITSKLKVEHRVIDLSCLQPLLKGSSQTDPSIPVPKGHYAEESMKQTVVPNRNAIMLSIAFGWAISLKYDAVAYAAHAGDHAIYPDCRDTFVIPFQTAMFNADWHRVLLMRPFLHATKGEIVREVAEINKLDILEQSYSCYEGATVQCGVCGTCSERRMAYIEAGVEDKVKYLNPLPIEYVKEAKEKNLENSRKRQTF